jgi:hypothetical protein
MVILIAIAVIAGLVALDVLALRFGADSRDGFTERSLNSR